VNAAQPEDTGLQDALRDALRETTGDPRADEFLRSTLLAGIVGTNQELLDVYEYEAGPEQAEFDIHLEGSGVDEHATNAKNFANFILGISEAVKETAKSRAGKGRYSEGLQIEGATPGSVRVVLKAPTPTVDPNQHVDPASSESTVDSDALRSIAAILTHASDSNPNSPLIAEIASLPKSARQGLKRAIKSSRRAGWSIDGTVRQRRIGSEAVSLSPAGASRLELELNSRVETTKTETLRGQIDGFRRSLGTLYFFPENRPQLQAAVSDSVLAARVAELFARPEQTVEAIFTVVESHLPGDTGSLRQSRALLSIKSIGAGGVQTVTNVVPGHDGNSK
jgi:hypothetical protein